MTDKWLCNDFWATSFGYYSDNEENDDYDNDNFISLHDKGSSYFIFNKEITNKCEMTFRVYSYDYKRDKDDMFSFGCGFTSDLSLIDKDENDRTEKALPNSLYFHSRYIDMENTMFSSFFSSKAINYDKIRRSNDTIKIYDENCCVLTADKKRKVDYDDLCKITVDMEKNKASVNIGNYNYNFNLENKENESSTYIWFYLATLRDTWSCFELVDFTPLKI